MPMSMRKTGPPTAPPGYRFGGGPNFTSSRPTTNSPILVRYVSEVAYRCCLTLSLYSRPHSTECAINEHRAIIAALVKGDESKVMSLMHSHLDSVANRALVAPAPQRGRDLLDILAPYAEEGEGDRVVKLPKVVRAR